MTTQSLFINIGISYEVCIDKTCVVNGYVPNMEDNGDTLNRHWYWQYFWFNKQLYLWNWFAMPGCIIVETEMYYV